MTDRTPGLDRRELMAGLGAAFLGQVVPAAAQTRPALALVAKADALGLRPGEQGGFKRSSQHSEVGGCDEHCKAAIDAVRTSLITIAGTTACCGTG